MAKYYYVRGEDGCDETFDIYDRDEGLVSVRFWEAEAWAESVAKRIVDALNAFDPDVNG